MSMIDNTLAAQVPTFDPATPLAQAGKLQAMEQENRAAQFKQAQTEIGSEARGLQPYVNTPEFPAKWAETADRLLQKGLLNPQTHQQWRNSPSPLMLKQMIAQTEDPTLTFRKEEAGREQKNQDRSFALQKTNADRTYGLAARAADRADDETPDNFEANPDYGKVDGAPKYRPIGPADPNYLGSVAKAKAEAEKAANGGRPEVGLQPAYGTTGDGSVGAIQFSKNGEAVQTKLPEGFKLSKEPIKMDMGTHIQMYDPITRQPIGAPIPKNVAAVEAEKEKGSAKGLAEVALPQMVATSKQILKTIDDIETHPGKEYSLGVWSKAPTVPGTSQADFRAAAGQLKGQTFLQAYNTLKGGGAITDIEGAKAENALARLDQAQSVGAYDTALKDFREVIKGAMERARLKAGKPSTPAERFKQLTVKDNLSKEEAYAKMHEEGY